LSIGKKDKQVPGLRVRKYDFDWRKRWVRPVRLKLLMKFVNALRLPLTSSLNRAKGGGRSQYS